MVKDDKIMISIPSKIALGAIVVLGLALRLYGLDAQSLWFDEVYTYLASRESWLSILFSPFDVNLPPLYYLIIHPLLAISESEFMLRLPSAIFGTLCIVIVYDLARKIAGEATGLLSAFLLAISPFHIWYSQEARPYMLLLLLSLAAIWFFRESARAPEQRGYRIGFVIATTLACYTHSVALSLFAIFFVYIFLGIPANQRFSRFAQLGLITLLVLPTLLRGLLIPPDLPADADQRFAPVNFIVYTLWTFGAGYSFGPNLADLHMPNRINLIMSELPTLLLFGATTVGLFLFGLFRSLQNPVGKLLIVWFIAPIAFVIVGALVTVHGFNVRYTIIALPVFVISIAWAISSLSNSLVRYVALALVTVASALSIWNYQFDEKYQRENTRAAVQYLESHLMPGDTAIVSSAYTQHSVRYYLTTPEPVNIIGYPKGNRIIGRDVAEFATASTVGSVQLETDLKRMVAGKDRFWLILSRTFDSDPYGQISEYFDRHYDREISQQWTGMELILYRTRSDQSPASAPLGITVEANAETTPMT